MTQEKTHSSEARKPGSSQQLAPKPTLNQPTGTQPHGQLVTRRLDQLVPHPSFARHNLSVPIGEFAAAASDADLSLREPIAITPNNVILKGYAQWRLAGLQSRETVLCIEYALANEEALKWLLQSCRRSDGLNDFARIVLALDLEPWLQDEARSKQRVGGQGKGSSTLTEARPLDVRREIAAAASVSTGNVTKVKQLLRLADPEVLVALRLSEVSIHRAWQWSGRSAEEQRRKLFEYRGSKGVKKTIRQLVSKHRMQEQPRVVSLTDLLKIVRDLDGTYVRGLQIAVVDAPGCGIFISQELFRTIDTQRELALP
jgi:hypothetical protein